MSASVLLTRRWFNRWSELEAAQKITCKLLKMLVADAVTYEPGLPLPNSLLTGNFSESAHLTRA
jgi:hypothetical protein